MTWTRKILAVLVAFAATPTLAAEPDAHASHHPTGAAQTAPAPPAPTSGATPGGAMMGGGSMMQGGSMMGGGGMMGGGMMGGGGMSCAGMAADRLTALRSDLALTPAQLPLWNAFADAAQATGQGLGMQQGMGMMGRAGTLPERLDRHESMLAARLDVVRNEKAALSPLYAALTPEQRATVDASSMCAPQAGQAGAQATHP